MAVNYDERVIYEFADRLYRRAASTIIVYTFLGGALGVLVVVLAMLFTLGWHAASMVHPSSLAGPAILVGGLAALLGFVVGRDRAFALRLMAQTALCQAQIERNTRMVAMSAAQQVMGGTKPPPVPRGA